MATKYYTLGYKKLSIFILKGTLDNVKSMVQESQLFQLDSTGLIQKMGSYTILRALVTYISLFFFNQEAYFRRRRS